MQWQMRWRAVVTGFVATHASESVGRRVTYVTVAVAMAVAVLGGYARVDAEGVLVCEAKQGSEHERM